MIVAQAVEANKYVTVDMNDMLMLSAIVMIGGFALVFITFMIIRLIQWLWVTYPLVEGTITKVCEDSIEVEYEFNGVIETGEVRNSILFESSGIPKYQTEDVIKVYRNPLNGKLKAKEQITHRTPSFSAIVMMAAYAAFFTSILVKLIMWKNELGPNIPNEIKVLKTTAETNIRLYVGAFFGIVLLTMIVSSIEGYIAEAKVKKQLANCNFIPVRAVITGHNKIWAKGGKNSRGYYKYYECYRYEYGGQNYVYTSLDYNRAHAITNPGSIVELNFNRDTKDITETKGVVHKTWVKIAEIVLLGLFFGFIYFIISHISL